jgi:hypothetical protein
MHTVCGILKHVMSSAAEAELGALFVNGKEATILRQTLEDMGWPQPPTPMQTDNSTACGIVNRTIKQQKSRAMDMRFYWIRDRTDQNQFHIFWAPGATILPNITPQRIIVVCAHTICTHSIRHTSYRNKIHLLSCGGVLIQPACLVRQACTPAGNR